MARINKISFNIANNGLSYTKRSCLDNSEMFISSKLNMLYKQAIKNSAHKSRRNLKKLVEGNNLDEYI